MSSIGNIELDELIPEWKQPPAWTRATYDELKKKLLDLDEDFNILLVGVIQAGKSSTIKTFKSAIKEDIKSYVRVAGADKSVTKTLEGFFVTNEIKVFDTQGFETSHNVDDSNEDSGPLMADIKSIIDGQILAGYKMETKEEIRFNDKNFDASCAEKKDVVVIVVDGEKIDNLEPSVLERLRETKNIVIEKGIGCCALLTKLDQASDIIVKDPTKMYESETAKQKMEKTATLLEMNLLDVFPIINYHDEFKPDIYKNIIALDSLTKIIGVADVEKEKKIKRTSFMKSKLLKDPFLRTSHFWQTSPAKALQSLKSNHVSIYNILLVGTVGSGKSTFINKLFSNIFGYATHFAPVGNGSEPTTVKHKVDHERGGLSFPIHLWDTMGLAGNKNCMDPDFVAPLIKGNIEKGTAFGSCSPHSPTVQSSGYTEKMHGCLLMIDGSNFHELDEKSISNLRTARKHANENVCPIVAIVTKADLVCQHVAKDLDNINKSSEIKKIVNEIERQINIPEDDILVVGQSSDKIKEDTLYLNAMLHVCGRAEDFLGHYPPPKPKEQKGLWATFWGK